jgi:uncharacterized Zn-finger protein
MAFTDFGIENLIDLVRVRKATPSCSSAATAQNNHPAVYAALLSMFVLGS